MVATENFCQIIEVEIEKGIKFINYEGLLYFILFYLKKNSLIRTPLLFELFNWRWFEWKKFSLNILNCYFVSIIPGVFFE